ncbi:MAG TPA: Wzz/FepE/Etk N-terminal domain-containing protein, partial [Tepidiformaceae bacterium]|nr:Wzz/FepE/Etk N-terminal domain-containing protein [Tepidiformaceae bacterium]
MTLRDYLKVARRWALVVVLGCVLSGGAAYLLTTRMDKVYQARAVILVNQRENQAAPSLQDIQGSQSLTKTYAELVTTSNNLERAAQILGNTNIKTLQKKVSADAVPETQLIEVLAEDRNADRAALIANTVAGLFPGYVEEAQLAGSETRTTINTVFVAEKALAPEDPVRPNPRVNVILGLVLGLMVMVAAVGLIEYFDDGVKEREDIERLAVPYLGSVLLADVPKGADKQEWVPSILSADPGDDLVESYRQGPASPPLPPMARGVEAPPLTPPRPGGGQGTT